MKQEFCSNGMRYGKGACGFANAHLSLFGRSIVVDYEYCLHAYFNHDANEHKVPCEMYPYRGDIVVFNVPIDKQFGKVNILRLIVQAIWLIIKERR